MDPTPRSTDPLTGLGDRRAFDDALAEAAEHARPLSLVLVELDRLDEIHVSHGPRRADRAVKEVAGALISVVRSPTDVCFRWREDGYAVLLPRTGGYEAEEVAGRLAEAVRAVCKRPDGTQLTIAYGAAQLTEPRAPLDLIEAADAALRAQQARDAVPRA